MPAKFVDTSSPVADGILRSTLQHPVSFHASVYHFLVDTVDSTSAGNSTHQAVLAICRQRALSGIRQSLKGSLATGLLPQLEGILVGVASFGYSTVREPRSVDQVSGPRQSPLTRMQNLQIWGRKYRFQNEHTVAMRKLVALRGGLLKLPFALQSLLSLYVDNFLLLSTHISILIQMFEKY